MSESGSRPLSLADLVMPRRPAGIAPAEGDDADAHNLLEANELGESTDELVALLASGIAIVQAAAARVLGARGDRGAVEPLRRLSTDRSAEETARVQAAYALARMGNDQGRAVLHDLLGLNPAATPAPLQAAGALAALGDPAGFGLVRAALDSSSRIAAIVACKQLWAFWPFRDTLDVRGAFDRAAHHGDPAVRGEALAQLEALTPTGQDTPVPPSPQ